MSARALLLVAGLAGLPACGSAPAPPDHYYRLGAAPGPAPLARPALPGVLVIARFRVDGLLAERALLWVDVEQPSEVRRYAYHYWADSPARLLQELFVQHLREARAADRVVTPELRVPFDYRLSAKLVRFEQLRGGNPRVSVEIEVALERVTDGSLVLLREYALEEPAEGEAVEDAVQAMDRALARIATSLVRDLAAR